MDESSPDHVLADNDERRTPDDSEKLKRVVGLVLPDVPRAGRPKQPKNGKATPHEAEWDGNPVLTMEGDGWVGLTAPFDGFSGLQLRRECVNWDWCGHGWAILAFRAGRLVRLRAANYWSHETMKLGSHTIGSLHGNTRPTPVP
jgi:hypothetical protein